jgi:hypothetical protein
VPKARWLLNVNRVRRRWQLSLALAAAELEDAGGGPRPRKGLASTMLAPSWQEAPACTETPLKRGRAGCAAALAPAYQHCTLYQLALVQKPRCLPTVLRARSLKIPPEPRTAPACVAYA